MTGRDRPGLTAAEALELHLLDPAPSRREFDRMIHAAHIRPVGWRHVRGPAAAEYDVGDLYRAHREWVDSRQAAGLPIG
jgi:hypothetical protein